MPRPRGTVNAAAAAAASYWSKVVRTITKAIEMDSTLRKAIPRTKKKGKKALT